jgi:hypothetical protein
MGSTGDLEGVKRGSRGEILLQHVKRHTHAQLFVYMKSYRGQADTRRVFIRLSYKIAGVSGTRNRHV